jgi:hypothetical protein
LFLFAWLC